LTVEGSNLLDLFIKECPFDASGSVSKHRPVFFCPVGPVCSQALRTFHIPPQFGVARDVRELRVVIKGGDNVSMERECEIIKFRDIR
jgi:hypothetical protein